LATDDLSGWFPVRIHWQDSEPVVEWCHFGATRFAEPFFDQTVERCLRHPFNQLFRRRTPMDALAELEREQPGVEPSGFVFHMSRCGSTLVSQMLAALPQNIVLSEVAPLDSVLRDRAGGDDGATIAEERRSVWLRRLVSALARPKNEEEARCFVKFDSWSVLQLPVVRRAFPGVPWVFIYRDPVEVLVSQLRRRGAHMVPGVVDPAVFGMDAREVNTMTPEEYCARVLASVCRAALTYHEEGASLLVNYEELPEAVCPRLTEFFGAAYAPGDLERMRRAAERDAKNPALDFVADGAAKNSSATDAVRRAAERFVRPVYEELESARKSRAAVAG
jgi:hypothetical protein